MPGTSDSKESDFQHPDMGEMTAEEYGQWLEENESDDLWSLVDSTIGPKLTHVVSVRFSPRELDLIGKLAQQREKKVSTLIRDLVMERVLGGSVALNRNAPPPPSVQHALSVGRGLVERMAEVLDVLGGRQQTKLRRQSHQRGAKKIAAGTVKPKRLNKKAVGKRLPPKYKAS